MQRPGIQIKWKQFMIKVWQNGKCFGTTQQKIAGLMNWFPNCLHIGMRATLIITYERKLVYKTWCKISVKFGHCRNSFRKCFLYGSHPNHPIQLKNVFIKLKAIVLYDVKTSYYFYCYNIYLIISLHLNTVLTIYVK